MSPPWSRVATTRTVVLTIVALNVGAAGVEVPQDQIRVTAGGADLALAGPAAVVGEGRGHGAPQLR